MSSRISVAIASKRISLLAVILLSIFARSGEAQQPVPSEKEAREEVARQKREWEERDLKRLLEDYEKVQRLLQAWQGDDRIVRIISDKMHYRRSPFLFDGIQWERCRAIRCPVGG
jgi:hypothetical protein